MDSFFGALKQYLFNIAVGLDQFVNILLLGDPDDTISSRLGRAARTGKQKWFVIPCKASLDFVMLKLFGEENHCDSSVESEESLDKEIWSWIKGAKDGL